MRGAVVMGDQEALAHREQSPAHRMVVHGRQGQRALHIGKHRRIGPAGRSPFRCPNKGPAGIGVVAGACVVLRSRAQVFGERGLLSVQSSQAAARAW